MMNSFAGFASFSQATCATFLRTFVFGVEDGLVSTAGLLAGLAVADTPRRTILVAGVVLVFVEAFSMAVGSLLSETSAEKYLTQDESMSRISLVSGIIMFFSYFIAGFLPLAPYVFLSAASAFPLSLVVSLVALFALGMLGAKAAQTNLLRGGVKMFLIGGLALVLGVAVGTFTQGIA